MVLPEVGGTGEDFECVTVDGRRALRLPDRALQMIDRPLADNGTAHLWPGLLVRDAQERCYFIFNDV